MWRNGVSLGQLESLYRARFDRFAGVAAAITGDGESGRDAVQTAFATAVRERRSFRGEGALEAWVWRIVVNEARRLRRQPSHQPFEESFAPATNGHGGGDELGLRIYLSALPERQRAAVFLRYHADLDYRQIAEILEVEVGTVSATLSAAHTVLRKRLGTAAR